MIIDRQKAQSELNTIVTLLKEQANFSEFLTGEKDINSWFWKQKHFPDEVLVASGETRVVFFLADSPEYVFKFDRREGNGHIDYNEQEYHVYELATASGVSNWFCPVMQMNIGPVTVLCSPYLDVDDCEMSDLSFDHQLEQYCADHDIDWDELSDDEKDDIRDEIDRDYSESTNGMVELMQSIYGYSAVANLVTFINEINLNDLHCGNWGTDGEHYFIIDYAGYNRVID